MNLNRNDIKFDHQLFLHNYFPHLMYVPLSRKPLQYLTVKDIGEPQVITESKEKVFQWLSLLKGHNGVFGEYVYNYVESIWDDAVSNIKSFTSLNIHVEGNMPILNDTDKTGIFTHIHPPRHGAPIHNVLTYITAAYQEQQPTAYFKYADFTDIDYKQRTQEEIIEGCNTIQTMAKSYADEYDKLESIPGLNWQKKYFPGADETLRIKFTASRYPHSTEDTGTEVYVIIVFNDVEFYEPLNEPGMQFDTFKNSL